MKEQIYKTKALENLRKIIRQKLIEQIDQNPFEDLLKEDTEMAPAPANTKSDPKNK